ncbi:MAG: hypothetical protein B6I25_04245 [Planctomycetales bacterium 4572_13]|nr:MAG: hypothetical protein B6I25_04245 [Planctomycetales bacterium 4572_13]
MDTRCCRICWNDEDWKKPAGVARDVEQGNSYASREGFGFEEWFFDYGMIDDNGYKYGFLQPLFGQNYDSYAGKDYDIVLYTLVPKNSAFYQSGRYFVAKISNCHILTPSEFKQVYEIYRQKNWLDKMKRQLKRLGLDPNQVDVEYSL